MTAADYLLLTPAAVVVIWTLVPFIRHDAWWVRAFDFPRVQIACLTGLVLLGNLAWRGWQTPLALATAVVLLACVIYQVARIVRYSPLLPVEVRDAVDCEPENQIGLLIANVLTPNRNASRLLEFIRSRSPDVILTVESDDWWEQQLSVLEERYAHTVKCPLDNLYGMHLYSRLPLHNGTLKFLVEDDVPSIHADVELRNGHRISLHCLHPRPPSPNENPTSTERDAELLLLARSLPDKPRSTVVTGDLNDVAWSATTRMFRHISGLLDPRIGRGMFSTFHAGYPFIRWPLDHLFCSADFSLLGLERLGHFGSDHFPIHVRLCHSPGAVREHDEPNASEAERDRAREKIAAARKEQGADS